MIMKQVGLDKHNMLSKDDFLDMLDLLYKMLKNSFYVSSHRSFAACILFNYPRVFSVNMSHTDNFLMLRQRAHSIALI